MNRCWQKLLEKNECKERREACSERHLTLKVKQEDREYCSDWWQESSIKRDAERNEGERWTKRHREETGTKRKIKVGRKEGNRGGKSIPSNYSIRWTVISHPHKAEPIDHPHHLVINMLDLDIITCSFIISFNHTDFHSSSSSFPLKSQTTEQNQWNGFKRPFSWTGFEVAAGGRTCLRTWFSVCIVLFGFGMSLSPKWRSYLKVLFKSEGKKEHELHERVGAASAVIMTSYQTFVMTWELSQKGTLSIYQSVFVLTFTCGHSSG